MEQHPEELPPKTVKAQLVRLDDNLKRIERTQFAGIQRAPGSLPVLEAFQLFLENERNIARRRLIMVTGIAIAAITFALVTAAIYIHHALKHANVQTDALAKTTEAMQQNLASLTQHKTSTDDMLQQTRQSLSEQQKAILAQSNAIKEQLQSTADARQEQSHQVIQLREQMEALLADQKTIREILDNSNPMRHQTRQQPPNAAIEDATANNTIGPTRRRVEKPEGVPPVQYAILTLAPEGRAGVRWMLPIGNAQE